MRGALPDADGSLRWRHGRLLYKIWLILHVPHWILSLYNGAHTVQHAFERMTTDGGIATIVHVFEFNAFARTVQHHFMHVRAQAAHGASTSNL